MTEPIHKPIFREINISAEIKRMYGPRWNSPELAYEFSNDRKFYLRTEDAGIYKRDFNTFLLTEDGGLLEQEDTGKMAVEHPL